MTPYNDRIRNGDYEASKTDEPKQETRPQPVAPPPPAPKATEVKADKK